MQRKLWCWAAVAAIFGSLSVTAEAYRGGPHEQRDSAMAPLEAVVGPKERELIHAVFTSDRTRLEVLREQLEVARKALIVKLLSSDKKIDVTQEVTHLKHAHDALLDERVNLALKARAIMSPQELSEASRLWTKWEDLRGQERALFDEAGRHDSGEQ